MRAVQNRAAGPVRAAGHFRMFNVDMTTRRSALLVLVAVIVLLAGCSRDPEVRKKKYFDSGVRYFEQAKYNEAGIEFSNAVKIDPNYAEAHYKLAQTMLRTGSFGNAFASLSRVVELQPQNIQARLDLGNLLLAGRRPDEAQQQVDAILKQDPNNAAAYALFANILQSKRDHAGALKQIRKAIELSPTVEYVQNLAVFQAGAGDFTAAEASLRKAISMDSKAAAPHAALAAVFSDQKRFADAEREARSAMQLDSRNPGNRALLARYQMAQNRRDLAEATLQQAKQDLPGDPRAYRLLGDFYFAYGLSLIHI